MIDIKTYSTFPKYLWPDLEGMQSYMAKLLLYKLKKQKPQYKKYKSVYEDYVKTLLDRYAGKYEGKLIKDIRKATLNNFFWLGMWIEEVKIIAESPNLDPDGLPWNDDLIDQEKENER